MRRFTTVLTAAFAVVAFSSMVFAQTATPAKVADKKVDKVAVKTEKVPVKAEQAVEKAAKPAKVAVMAANGKVAKLDEATKTLTVTTKDGDKDFMLGADAKIMAGAKAATMADLVAGKTVKVTYTTVEGKHMASKVTIAAEPKPAKAVKEVKK